MRDNHTFVEIKGDDLREIAFEYIKTAKENPYGLVCQPFVGNKKVGINCHVDRQGNFNIKGYFQELLNDKIVRKIFKYD